jgi:hypothetical protein
VAIVEKASTPRQRTILGTVATIPTLAEEEGAAAPAVVVVGEVVHVLLERGQRVLHGAIGWWGEEGKGKEGEGEGQAVQELVNGGGAVRLGGMRGGGEEVGEKAPASLPRRLVTGVVGAVGKLLSRGKRRLRQ